MSKIIYSFYDIKTGKIPFPENINLNMIEYAKKLIKNCNLLEQAIKNYEKIKWFGNGSFCAPDGMAQIDYEIQHGIVVQIYLVKKVVDKDGSILIDRRSIRNDIVSFKKDKELTTNKTQKGEI